MDDVVDGQGIHPALVPGGVAVVTGAASGIGLALSKRFTAMGLQVAMLDVDADRLDAVSGDVAAISPSAKVPLVKSADVSSVADLESVRASIRSHFGAAPSVLINNAATRVGGGVFSPVSDWRTTFEVNLWGMVNGVNVFVPEILDAGQPGLIVNVGSKQGITNPPGNTAYNMTKAAVRTFAEALEHDLRGRPECRLTSHLLVPGWTTTGDREHKQGAWLPDQVVDYMMAALERRSFYIICPDDDVDEEMDRARFSWTTGDIIEDRPPLSRWMTDYRDRFETFFTDFKQSRD